METLTSHKFVEYFSAMASTKYIKDGIQPPKDAKEIFMGGGIIGSNVLKMGVFGTTGELFDQREYRHYANANAKSVRKYYAYYDSGDNETIGFSKTPTICLSSADTSNTGDESKLSAHTTYRFGPSLWRCGATKSKPGNFDHTYQIVFYYHT